MPTPPSGTVTFLFTDIEGSTRLWESHPEEMRRALAFHDAVLQERIERNGGCVFKKMGDAFCAAFERPHDALRAASEAQRRLLPELKQFRVRMAVYTGEAEAHDGDYFGPSLNRVARLLSVAHGGQILVARAAMERLDPDELGSTRLRSLGRVDLRDVPGLEQVYQAEGAGLAARFPPLNTPKAAFRRAVRIFAAAAAVAAASLGVMAYLALQANARAGRFLYFSDMLALQSAADSTPRSSARVMSLLDETRKSPERGFEWGYWWGVSHHLQPLLPAGDAFSFGARWSGDSRRFITTEDGFVVRDGDTGRPLSRFGPPGVRGTCIPSRDGKYAVSQGDRSGLAFWDTRTGAKLAEIPRLDRVLSLPSEGRRGRYWPVQSVAFSPDGSEVAVTFYGVQGVTWWEIPSGRLVGEARINTLAGERELPRFRSRGGGTEKVRTYASLILSRSGRLAASYRAPNVEIWDARSGKLLRKLRVGSETGLRLRFSADERLLLATSGVVLLPGEDQIDRGGELPRVWDLASGSPRPVAVSSRPLRDLSFMPGGRVIGIDGTGSVVSWDPRTGAAASQWLTTRAGASELSPSPDGRRLVVVDRAGVVSLGPAEASGSSMELSHPAAVSSGAWAPGGAEITTTCMDGSIRRWDAATGRILSSTSPGGDPVLAVAQPPGSREMVAVTGGSRDSGRLTALTIRCDASPRPRLTRVTSTVRIAAILPSPDGRLIAITDTEEMTRVFDAATGREAYKIPEALRIAFSPDSRRILAQISNRKARIFDAGSGREILKLKLGEDELTGPLPAFSADGRTAFTCTPSGVVTTWNPVTGSRTGEVVLPTGSVVLLCQSPDRRRFATGHVDGTLRLWDAQTGRLCLELRGHTGAVKHLAFSADGLRLLSVAADNVARVWVSADLKRADAQDAVEDALRREQERRSEARSGTTWQEKLFGPAGSFLK